MSAKEVFLALIGFAIAVVVDGTTTCPVGQTLPAGSSTCILITVTQKTTTVDLGGLETPLIIGIAVGSFFGLVCIIVLIVGCIMKCKKKKANVTPADSRPAQAGTSIEMGSTPYHPPPAQAVDDYKKTKPPPYTPGEFGGQDMDYDDPNVPRAPVYRNKDPPAYTAFPTSKY